MNRERLIDGFGRVAKEVLFFAATPRVNVENQELLPKEGPAVLVWNHTGWFDLVVVISLSPQMPVTLAKAEVFNYPIIKNILPRLKIYPIKRDVVDRQALNFGVEVLKNNGLLTTSIEGTRGRESDGTRRQLKRAKCGLVRIIKEASKDLGIPIPVTPIGIWGGAEYVAPEIDNPDLPLRKRLSFSRRPIYVKVGEPILVSYVSGQLLTTKSLQPEADRLMMGVRNLLPRQYHGYYAQNFDTG